MRISSAESERLGELEQESRELRRSNEILKRAAAFFGAALDRRPAEMVAFIDSDEDEIVDGKFALRSALRNRRL